MNGLGSFRNKMTRVFGKLIILLFSCSTCLGQQFKIPNNIKFGTATSSYQIEGAWNINGKGESIWDNLIHNKPENVHNQSTGDIACNSYNLYKRDVEMLKELGVDFYRFSISWTRILPTGFANSINEDGIRYYNDLINELIDNGIEPYITLYHWDLPQPLQDLGGWTNPIMADYFVEYARVVFEHYADRVKYWFTFNEPSVICVLGYGYGIFAPLVNSDGRGEYLCSHTVLMAHGRTYRLYEEQYKDKYPAKIGITDECFRILPFTPETEHLRDVAMDFSCHFFLDPLFTGDYPDYMRRNVAEKSQRQGFSSSRLPEFTLEQSKIINGTADFIAIQHYGSSVVRSATEGDNVAVPSLFDDLGGVIPLFETGWNSSDPDNFRWIIVHLMKRYNNPEILITENGLGQSSEDDGLVDDKRVEYVRKYMKALLDAITEDGANVVAYTMWTLMDNFEWIFGYNTKYGIYHVDFQHPNRTRTPKKSALVYQEIIRTRSLDFDFEP